MSLPPALLQLRACLSRLAQDDSDVLRSTAMLAVTTQAQVAAVAQAVRVVFRRATSPMLPPLAVPALLVDTVTVTDEAAVRWPFANAAGLPPQATDAACTACASRATYAPRGKQHPMTHCALPSPQALPFHQQLGSSSSLHDTRHDIDDHEHRRPCPISLFRSEQAAKAFL